MVSPSKKKLVRGKLSDKKYLKTRLTYKPLLKKRFYLDVNNFKGIDSLKRDLIHLGGVVDDFFVKEVNYVITNRFLNSSIKGSSSENTQQQQSPNILCPISPSTPQIPSSVCSNSCDSLNLDSPKDEAKRKASTRAEALLERARLKKHGTCDVLENAKLWSIPVWPLSKLLKWLQGLKDSPLYVPPAPNREPKNSLASNSKFQKLKAPFIKFEGFKREYRPHFKELQKWPNLNLNSRQDVSPFADLRVKEKPLSSTYKDIYTNRQKGCKVYNKGKIGFCELCSTNYSNLKLHLQSEAHLSFVRDKSNYEQLDKLISEYDLSKLGH